MFQDFGDGDQPLSEPPSSMDYRRSQLCDEGWSTVNVREFGAQLPR
jgi:hypothetical protein